ncbi:MAG TPA: CBS domain-containing protein [Accumulibacter sp.]|jgi:CBS domain-containing protein|nr:CBS domain-containing protein [Accumulibacter sp.]HQC80053.1 CBS domain-containing protein [Accumulibacter sp.]
MKTLRQILASKDRPLISVSPSDSVYQALSVMAYNNVGAVLVLDQGKLVGIFSERDYARKGILQGKASKDTPVRELMTARVYYVTLDRSVDECMAIMTDRHFRHLPIIEDDQVVGIVSIGDVVKETISAQQFIIDQLEKYITG